MAIGNRRFQYLIVSAVSFANVIGGILFSWSTPVLPKISANETNLRIDSAELSWIVSISSIGFLTGSCVARTTIDTLGRRITILASSVPILPGTVLLAFAWEFWTLLSARFLCGCGSGLIVSASSLYICEIVDKEIRGSMAIVARCMMAFGFLLVILLGSFLSYQTLNYLLVALSALLLVVCWMIPETPYFLLKVNKVDTARKTLGKLTNFSEDALEENISEMRSHVRIEMMRSGTLKELVTGKRYRKAIWIVVAMRLPQIMSGLRAVQNYLGLILVESNSEINITIALIIYGSCRFLLGLTSSLLVDRVGRRPLLILSFLGTGVCIGIVAAYYTMYKHYGVTYPLTLIPFVFIILAVIISSSGFESVAYLVPAELFPMNVKAIAMASVSVFGGLINFVSVKTYQQIKDWIGLSGVFTFYTVAAFMGSLLCYLLVPETKGKSLKQIQIELNGNIYEDEEKLNGVVVNDVVKQCSTAVVR